MVGDLLDLLRERSLIALALAIAFGWSLFQFAHGVAGFVDALFFHFPIAGGGEGVYVYPLAFSSGGALTWEVHHHVVTLDGMLVGLVELAVVAVAAALLARRGVPRTD